MLLTAGCEDKCEECDGPGLCTRCFPPFLQSAGHCVQSCPERSFTDNENNCRREWCFVCLLSCFVCTVVVNAVASSLFSWVRSAEFLIIMFKKLPFSLNFLL